MGTILVTGGAGFIGSNFVHSVLARDGYDVVVLDKLTYAGSMENLADLTDNSHFLFVAGDIADPEVVEQVFAEHFPVAVVNFAAETHVDRSIDSPRPFIDTNIVGTYTLLETARHYLEQADDDMRAAFRLLHVSTDEVYGSLGADGLFSETTAYAPNSPYAASKASADHLVRAYHHTYGLSTLLTNCSNNYGPYQFPEKLIPLMILNALEGRPLPIYGDGKNVRDWLYVEDHCNGIWSVLREGRVGESYNIGGGCEMTNIEVVDTLCEMLERMRPAADNPALAEKGIASYGELKTFVPDRLGHDRRYAIDFGKIRGELGWEPGNDFAAGMERTVSWYLENLDWCKNVQQRGAYNRERLGL